MSLSPPTISALVWLAFIVYWSAAAKNSAPTLSAESPKSRQIHQSLMWGALVLALVRFPPLDRRWLPESSLLVPVGFAIQLSSFALAVWARRHLGRNWSGAIEAKADHHLIRTGPYRLVRHPIYSGMLGMFLGTALITGEYHSFLGLVIMSAAYVRKIRLEEQRLREVFAGEYGAYQRETKAVIPWLL